MTDELEPQLPLDLQPKPTIVYQAHAFSSFNEIVQAQQGKTVAEMVASLGFPADYDGYIHVWINDLPLEREMWEHLIPSAGQMVYVRVIPRGGGGRDGGKDVLRTIASIAIAVIAVATGQYWAAEMGFTYTTAAGTTALTMTGQVVAASIAAGVTILGNMALNAIIPPPKLELDNGSGLGSQKNQLTGSSNRFAPYAPIPRVFGKRRLYPLLAGRPYSETQGDDEYLRMALLVGWGPLRISDIKIGETPITSFSEVEYEVREGWTDDAPLTKYTNTITENGYAILLAPSVGSSYTYNTRTTESGVTEISVHVTAPSGVAKFESNGTRSSINVDVRVQYAVAGSGSWTTPVWLNSTDPGLDENGRIRFSGADTSTLRRTGRFSVPAGQYDVRIYRETSEYDITKHVQEVRWTVMRNVKPSYPVQQKNVALIALRIKATGQLNGVPQQISCVAESYLPVYNGTSWSYEITRNPAWAFADVLRRRAGESYLPDSRIDLTTIQGWATACDATAPNASEPYWRFDGVIEGGTVFQVLRQIASSARANYTIRDGKHSVVRDVSQTVPAQHITPRNSFGYSGTKVFLDYPHAMRVVFVNADKNYEEDERIVYDDGYNAANATKFETLELFGCTSSTQAYREGRYYIAAARLRPETHTVSMDIENLRCTIGDLVRFSHDVVSIGIVAARIVSVSGTTIVLDQELPFVSGSNFGLRVRLSDGDYVIVSLQNPGDTATNTVTAISSTAGIAAGDLAMFGQTSSVTVPMIVRKIEPGSNFTAKLHLVDAQAGVYTADTGTIPPFNSNITTEQPIENRRPETPTVFSVRSDDTVALLLADGTLQVRIAVSVAPPASSVLRIDYYDVQWRESGAVNWIEERYARGTPIFLSPVQVDVAYQIRVRGVSEYGVPGEWSSITTHTVVGKNSPPGDVENLTAGVGNSVVEIKWAASADSDYDYTELRLGSSWSTAPTMLWKGKGTTYLWSRPTNGTYTIWAAHRDTSGNYSATPKSVSATVTDAVIDPPAKQTATVYLYQWSSAQPSNPDGQSLYTWASALHDNYTGGNGWSTTIPSNPGVVGVKLWIATKSITALTTVPATTVSWSANTFTVAQWSAPNGTNGVQSTQATVYQWAITIPSGPTGTATYTWNTGSFGAAPSGWSLTPGTAPSPGYTLWAAAATVTDTANNATTSFNWATASITARGYSGTNGVSATKIKVTGDNWNANTNFYTGRGVEVNGTALTLTSYRGLTVAVINPATGALVSQGTYDTYAYGSSAVGLIAFLDGVAATNIVAIYSNDAIGLDQTLLNKLKEFGSPGLLPVIEAQRRSYVFLGQKGLQVGQGYEKSTLSSGPDGVISVEGYYTSTGLIGNGATGPLGQQGASSRIAYARIANNPSPIAGTVTVSGDNVPGQTASNSIWGLNVAWSTTDPNPSSTSTLYVVDGIYNPVTGNTVWSTPYIASLKVGTLSAITVNTGDLTVNGTLTVSSGGMVTSSNYVANTSGWKIDNTGAEFPAAAITHGTIANARIGDLSAKRIFTGGNNPVTFADSNDPNLYPFNSTASGYLYFSGNTAVSTYVQQYCYDSNTNQQVDCSYYVTQGQPVTGTAMIFEVGNGNKPIGKRLKSGVIRFTIICSATVDHYLSIWSRKWNGSAWESWIFLAETIEPQNGYGTAMVQFDGDIVLYYGQAVQFGMGAFNSNKQYYNSSFTNMTPGHLVVFAQNF